jgi:hypothetical protein
MGDAKGFSLTPVPGLKLLPKTSVLGEGKNLPTARKNTRLTSFREKNPQILKDRGDKRSTKP